MPVFMMATKAIHKLGDISSDEPDLCCIHSYDDKNFYGSWVLGFGFMDVRFPKDTTRKLTEVEASLWSGQRVAINDQPSNSVATKDELLGDGHLKKWED